MKTIAYVAIAAAIMLVSVGRAPAATRRHWPAPRAAAALVDRCAYAAGALVASPDRKLGGNAYWLSGHFAWGYVENNYGRVTDLIPIRDGFVPWQRIAACLRPTGIVGGLR